MKLSIVTVALVFTTAALLTAGTASACNVVGYKNGERLCGTTHVYKDGRSKSWTNPGAYKKPAEQCRATCLRDAMKWGTSTQQTAYFNMCTRNNGCQ